MRTGKHNFLLYHYDEGRLRHQTIYGKCEGGRTTQKEAKDKITMKISANTKQDCNTMNICQYHTKQDYKALKNVSTSHKTRL